MKGNSGRSGKPVAKGHKGHLKGSAYFALLEAGLRFCGKLSGFSCLLVLVVILLSKDLMSQCVTSQATSS